MTDADAEFAFFAGDAERMGVSALPAITRETLKTAQGEISLLRFGVEEPRATFLHGAGLNAHTFDPVILGINAPIVSVDLPGHGRSQWRTDADYRPEINALAIAEVMRHITRVPQVLVGHSLGGLTALRLGAEHPNLLRHVVLLDITPGVKPDDGGSTIREFIGGQQHFESVDEIIDRAIAFNIGHDRETLRRGVTLNTRTRGDGRLEWTHHLAHLLADTTEDGETSPFAPSSTPGYSSLWADARAIAHRDIPITLIRGTSGMITDDLEREWLEYFPASTVISLEAGHNVQEHNPKKLAAVLAQIINS